MGISWTSPGSLTVRPAKLDLPGVGLPARSDRGRVWIRSAAQGMSLENFSQTAQLDGAQNRSHYLLGPQAPWLPCWMNACSQQSLKVRVWAPRSLKPCTLPRSRGCAQGHSLSSVLCWSLCPAHSAPPAGASRVGLPLLSAPPVCPAAPWVGSSLESLEGNLRKPGVSGLSPITFWQVCWVPGKGLTSHKSPQSLLRAGSIPNTLYAPSLGLLSSPWGGQGSEDWNPPWAHTSLHWTITSGSPLPHPSWQNLPISRTHWIGPGKWNRGHEWGTVTKSRQQGPHHHLAVSLPVS